jgi:hypothetical protein
MIQDVHPGSGSRIRILVIYPSRIPGSKRHRISDSDPQHWFQVAQPNGHFEHVEGRHTFPLPAPHPHILGVNFFQLSMEDFILTIV